MVRPRRSETQTQERHQAELEGPVGMLGKVHSQTSRCTAEAPLVEVLQEIIQMLENTNSQGAKQCCCGRVYAAHMWK